MPFSDYAYDWARLDTEHPELAELITAWPALPEPIRTGILAMIRAASG